jgi:hypothetical protein
MFAVVREVSPVRCGEGEEGPMLGACSKRWMRVLKAIFAGIGSKVSIRVQWAAPCG